MVSIHIEITFPVYFSELNNNDPIQSTHVISRHEVEIQLTNGKNILTETTPTNDVNQVGRCIHILRE